jgi:hypothetical protein
MTTPTTTQPYLVHVPAGKALIDRHLLTMDQAGDTASLSMADQILGLKVPGLVYVSGPMSGIKDYNYPAFHAAAAALRAEGLQVMNPAEQGLVEGADWDAYMRFNLAQMQRCTVIALLPGWSRSRGACLEKLVADGLGMEVRFLPGAEQEPLAAAS